MKKIYIVICFVLLIIPKCSPLALELLNGAKSGVLLEASTGEILYEKNKDEKVSIASLTKMVAQIIILEKIEEGTLKWDDIVTTSSNAAGMGGTQIWLVAGEKMSVEDLFKSMTMASANDATVALAEKVAGTEEAFVKLMNDKVKSLGLVNTTFVNCTGFDEEGHLSTAYDLGQIARELLKHDEILRFSSVYEDYIRKDTPNKYWLVNTNKLVRFYSGADGLKTGFTDSAGYTMAVTAERDNMRLIAIVLGEASGKARNQEATDLLDYGFNTYKVDLLNKKNEVVKELEIEKGNKSRVNAILKHDVSILRKKSDAGINYDTSVKINDIRLPLKKGDVVGKLEVLDNGNVIKSEDLIIDEDVSKINYFKHLYNSLKNIISGNFI